MRFVLVRTYQFCSLFGWGVKSDRLVRCQATTIPSLQPCKGSMSSPNFKPQITKKRRVNNGTKSSSSSSPPTLRSLSPGDRKNPKTMGRALALRLTSLFLSLLSWVLLLLPTTQARPVYPRGAPPNVEVVGDRVCLHPAPWTQILSFFLTNYIARIATFKKTSGYKGSRDYLRTAVSLFVPFYGISQAAETIARGARFLGRDELGGALHAGALCVLQRNETWRPTSGDIIRGCTVEPPGRRSRKKKKKRRRESGSRHVFSPCLLQCAHKAN